MLFLFIPIILYVFLILWISHHWLWGKISVSTSVALSTQVTVLIPFKNEATNLPGLLEQLKAQNYPHVNFVFINDHSSDGGELLIRDSFFTLVDSTGAGKKAALQEGLNHVKGQLIVTLDADCLPQNEWLETIVSAYEQTASDLIICPVRLSPIENLWEKLQAVEFQSLVASTAGAALGGHPIMCNAANLAFSSSLVDTDEDVFNDDYASGDDMFLLEYAKRQNAKITYLKDAKAMVTTTPKPWTSFWKQRLRWTSKTSGYSDVMILMSGSFVLLSNLSLLVLPFISLPLALVAFVMKAMVDGLLLISSASFFNTKKYLWAFLILLPFYPFYVLIATVGGLLQTKK